MSKRTIWQLPFLHKEGDSGEHRSATWLELFFDLFFVVVIGSLTHVLAENISIEGIKQFVIAFIPILWVWFGVTFYNERFETEGVENRIFVFLLMIPVTGLAVFAHNATGENLKYFLLAYALARIIIIVLWARAGYYNKPFRPTAYRYIIGFGLSVVLVVIASFINSPMSNILFPIALVIDLLTPLFTVRHQKKLPSLTTSKLPERFGLFAIIVLGEIVVGIIAGLSHYHHLNFSIILLGILGIATALGSWWLYFDFIARRPFHSNLSITVMWSYLHMPLVITFVLIGAGLANLIGAAEHPEQHIVNIYMVTVGTSLFVMGLLELTLERDEKEPAHPLYSPLFKFITGILGLILGFSGIIHSSFMALLLGFVLILVNMLYGAYAWFSQELDETATDA